MTLEDQVAALVAAVTSLQTSVAGLPTAVAAALPAPVAGGSIDLTGVEASLATLNTNVNAILAQFQATPPAPVTP